MKTLTKRQNYPVNGVKAETSYSIIGFFMHFAALLCGFVMSNAVMTGFLSPFGIAFVGGIKKKYLAAGAAGAAAGYLININSGGFAYIAAILAITAIRMIIGNSKRWTGSSAMCGIITFVTMLAVALSVSAAYNVSFITKLGEAAIAAIGAYFISTAFNIYITAASGLDIEETVAVTFFVSIILIFLYNIKPLGLSVGRILATTIILSSARYGQAMYGAVSGAVISFTLAVTNGEYSSESSIFAFSGLMSGVFSRLGSLGMIGAYLITTIVSSLITGNKSIILLYFFESLIGSGLFLLIPKKAGSFLGGILSMPTEISKPDSIRGALIMRLEFASGALKDVFETVEDVAERLKKINAPDLNKTLSAIESQVCIGCSLRKHCWETAKEITADDIMKKWNNMKSGNQANKIQTNCIRETALDDSVRSNCADYESRRSAEARISEVRGVISDQFEGISNMLYDLSEEFKYEVRHDETAAENIILTMKNLGFHAISCVASKDKFGRLSADIKIKGVIDHAVNKAEIMKNLSLAVGRDFDIPSVSYGGDEAFIFISEKPVYKIEVGISQISKDNGKLCGDSYKYFSDGRGRFIMLLSDGMGTGGRAAVDSSMVSGLMSRMLRSGFGFDCSLKIINSSMLFKSTDESLATVDIAAIDLFTGQCELLKAGAGPTFVKHKNRVGKAESTSLPPGILRDVSFEKAKVSLKSDDVVVMVSDGVVSEGDDWVCSMIRNFKCGYMSAQQLSDEIAGAAQRRFSKGHGDDITVMTAVVHCDGIFGN